MVLPLPNGFLSGQVRGGNMWGEKVGDVYSDPNGLHRAVRWYESEETLLGRDGEDSIATTINRKSEIFGGHQSGNVFLACQFFLNGTVIDIPSVPGTSRSEVICSNDAGDVAGDVLTADGKNVLGFVRMGTKVTTLGPYPYYPDTQVFSMNNSGEVVGAAMTGLDLSKGPYVPFYRQMDSAGNVASGYYPVPLGYNGAALGINDAGTAVGVVEKQGGGPRYGVVWSANSHILQYLQNLSTPGFNIQVAYGINNQDEIVAYGQDAAGKRGPWELTPTTAKGSCSTHFTPTDEAKPGERTGVWCGGQACQETCHLESHNPQDPKDDKDEGTHDKDNPLPYDKTRVYRCTCHE